MSLRRHEQIIFDHIKSNRNLREFWEAKIDEFRLNAKDDDEFALTLSENLALIYNGSEEAREDLEGLIDGISFLTLNYTAVAFALLGRGFRAEAIDAMTKPTSSKTIISCGPMGRRRGRTPPAKYERCGRQASCLAT